ncbi:MAG: hypothetical protein HY940_09265 [Gammaproteobacteria bacterium]|nr:hypothetical protein [Gammaproteobacteria bacterium]
MEQTVAIKDLSQLIGRHIRYEGIAYQVIEVLEHDHKLVLQDVGHHTTIQADQHGEARRRVPQTRTLHVPLLDNSHFDLAGIDLLDR